MRHTLHKLRDESGEGLITGLIILAGILIPLMFIVPLFGRIETARLAVEQAARDGVRVSRAVGHPAAGQRRRTSRDPNHRPGVRHHHPR